jgi:DNA-binding NarL/FixJ family response regulator
MSTTMSDTVRVLVVDDSATTRTMLREALGLAGGIEVIGEANDGREAVSIAGDLEPDVVLMDIRMPDGDGIQAAREITARNPSTRVVALTWLDDAGTVREMLAAGAMGYVVKGGTMDELADAIRRRRARRSWTSASCPRPSRTSAGSWSRRSPAARRSNASAKPGANSSRCSPTSCGRPSP